MIDDDETLISKYNEKTRRFVTSKTVNILNNLQLININEKPQPEDICYENKNQIDSIEIADISNELQVLVEQHIPVLSNLDGEPIEYTKGKKFFCTTKDILTSHGEFWVEREFSNENERKFRHFIRILSLFAASYKSMKNVYVGQLAALYYQSSWHRALVVSINEFSRIRTNARVRLVDYGSSLYVNVSQLKWLPEQFYLFPFKAVECIFSEAVKSTFSDIARLTFKQIVFNRRLHATIYDKDGTRLCVLLKCKIDEGIINIYRYLRANEHQTKNGRTLSDTEIFTCLRNTINNSNDSFDQMNGIMKNRILPVLTPPSPIKFTRDQLIIKRKEIDKICNESTNDVKEKSEHDLIKSRSISNQGFIFDQQ